MAGNHSPDIVFLVPYFGKLPTYFDAFLLSVANKNFDIIFFSDCKKPKGLPVNIQWSVCSFSELKTLIIQKTELPVSLNAPYKLCDFRPAFGIIFEDFIKGYNFWGSIDIDLCMGNFEKYINNSVLEKPDVFSGIKEYLSGAFFFVRNTEYHNLLFKKSKDWQHVFTEEKYLGFDECGGRFFKELKAGKTFKEFNPSIESFSELLFKEPSEKTRLAFKDIIIEPTQDITSVYTNKVLYNNLEYLLVHFIDYKTARTFYTNKKIRFPFYVNRFGFFNHKPGLLIIFFSKNFWASVIRKLIYQRLRITV